MSKKKIDSEGETMTMIDLSDTRKQAPKTYLRWSIVNLVCSIFCVCGLFFSMAAFSNSFKTQDDLSVGNLVKARRHSKMAKKFNVIVTALCFIGLIFIIVALSFKSIYTIKTQKLFNNNNKQSNVISPNLNDITLKEINFTQAIIGHWKMISSENFEAYLSEIKADFLIKSLADMFSPNVEFQLNGDEWKIIGSTAIKAVTSTFKLNEEFEEELFGLPTKSLFRLENNRFFKTQSHRNNQTFSWVTFEVPSYDKMVNTFYSKTARGVRTFKRVEFNEYD